MSRIPLISLAIIISLLPLRGEDETETRDFVRAFTRATKLKPVIQTCSISTDLGGLDLPIKPRFDSAVTIALSEAEKQSPAEWLPELNKALEPQNYQASLIDGVVWIASPDALAINAATLHFSTRTTQSLSAVIKALGKQMGSDTGNTPVFESSPSALTVSLEPGEYTLAKALDCFAKTYPEKFIGWKVRSASIKIQGQSFTFFDVRPMMQANAKFEVVEVGAKIVFPEEWEHDAKDTFWGFVILPPASDGKFKKIRINVTAYEDIPLAAAVPLEINHANAIWAKQKLPPEKLIASTPVTTRSGIKGQKATIGNESPDGHAYLNRYYFIKPHGSIFCISVYFDGDQTFEKQAEESILESLTFTN